MFFNPGFSSRKCECGFVFGFHVQKALEFIGVKLPLAGPERLRSFVRLNRIGCTNVRVRCHERQYVGIHVQRSFLDKQLDQKLHSGSNSIIFKFSSILSHISIVPGALYNICKI